MNIAVIGSIHRDTIYPYTGQAIESYGGILYNLIPLATLGKENVTLFPVCHIGCDVADSVLNIVNAFPNIETGLMHILQRKNNHAVLTYTSPLERREQLHHRLPPLTSEQLEAIYDCDVILVNFISGTELSYSTFKQLRKRSSGILYVDMHSLSFYLTGNRPGSPPHTPSWKEWITETDICQMNREEAGLLAGKPEGAMQDLKRISEEIWRSGPNIVLITLGSDGSLVTCESPSGCSTHHIPPIPVTPVDVTGCGDVFASTFIFSYLDTRDPVAACRFANEAAAIKSTQSGIDEVHTIGALLSA